MRARQAEEWDELQRQRAHVGGMAAAPAAPPGAAGAKRPRSFLEAPNRTNPPPSFASDEIVDAEPKRPRSDRDEAARVQEEARRAQAAEAVADERRRGAEQLLDQLRVQLGEETAAREHADASARTLIDRAAAADLRVTDIRVELEKARAEVEAARAAADAARKEALQARQKVADALAASASAEEEKRVAQESARRAAALQQEAQAAAAAAESTSRGDAAARATIARQLDQTNATLRQSVADLDAANGRVRAADVAAAKQAEQGREIEQRLVAASELLVESLRAESKGLREELREHGAMAMKQQAENRAMRDRLAEMDRLRSEAAVAEAPLVPSTPPPDVPAKPPAATAASGVSAERVACKALLGDDPAAALKGMTWVEIRTKVLDAHVHLFSPSEFARGRGKSLHWRKVEQMRAAILQSLTAV